MIQSLFHIHKWLWNIQWIYAMFKWNRKRNECKHRDLIRVILELCKKFAFYYSHHTVRWLSGLNIVQFYSQPENQRKKEIIHIWDDFLGNSHNSQFFKELVHQHTKFKTMLKRFKNVVFKNIVIVCKSCSKQCCNNLSVLCLICVVGNTFVLDLHLVWFAQSHWKNVGSELNLKSDFVPLSITPSEKMGLICIDIQYMELSFNHH